MADLVTIPGVDLIAAGTWNLASGRQTFTREDLRHAVEAAACPSVGNPVIKIGHVDERFRDGEPALGQVTNMRTDRAGVRLLGDLAGVPRWLADIAASAYPHRSVEGRYDFTCQIGHTHPFVITALALLGVVPSGVGVLRGIDDIPPLFEAAAAGDGGDMSIGLSWEELQEALRDGRLGERTALLWLEERQRQRQIRAAAPREVRAHSNSQVGQVVHRAIDQALGLGGAAPADDEFAGLFPPTAPLGPLGEHETEPKTSLIYPGEGQGRRRREPVTWDGYTRASAYAPFDDGGSDAAVFRAMYGYDAPEGYFDE